MLRCAWGNGMPVFSESSWARSSAWASSSSATRHNTWACSVCGFWCHTPDSNVSRARATASVDGRGAAVRELRDRLFGHRIDDRDGLALARALTKLLDGCLYRHTSSPPWLFVVNGVRGPSREHDSKAAEHSLSAR